MKAVLTPITDKMTGETELTVALNENFDALNDAAHNREMSIFSRFNEVVSRINEVEKNLLTAINNLADKKAKPDKDLLTDNEG
jgi:hypothetical protein